jgi:hypothetical protein
MPVVVAVVHVSVAPSNEDVAFDAAVDVVVGNGDCQVVVGAKEASTDFGGIKLGVVGWVVARRIEGGCTISCCGIETDDVVDKGDFRDDGDDMTEDDSVAAVPVDVVGEDMSVTRTGARSLGFPIGTSTYFWGVYGARGGGKACILRRGDAFQWARRDRNQARHSVVMGVSEVEEEEEEDADASAPEKDPAGGLLHTDML